MIKNGMGIMIVFGLLMMISPISASIEYHAEPISADWQESSSYGSYLGWHMGRPFDSTRWGTQFWQTSNTNPFWINYNNDSWINNNTFVGIEWYDAGKVSTIDPSCPQRFVTVYNNSVTQILWTIPADSCQVGGASATWSRWNVTIKNPTGVGVFTNTNTNYYSMWGVRLYWIPNSQEDVVDFTGVPTNGTAPLSVTFTAENLANSTGITWNYGDGQLQTGNISSIFHTYQNPGIYSVSMEYTALNGSRYTVSKPNYINARSQGNLSVLLDVRDGFSPTHPFIQNAQVGIKNVTSGVWRNSTAPSGAPIFQSTGANFEYPLTQNQTITLAAGAFGYDNQSVTFAIPYDKYEQTIFLTPVSKTAGNGTWNVIVLIKSNKYGTPLLSATVELTTGVNGAGFYSGLTDDSGIVSFYNVTASTTAMIRAVRQGYRDTSVVVPVFPNTTQHVTIEMLGLQDTPVTTPIPTQNKTPLTGVPTPEITDENGNPITSREGKANWGLDQLFDIIPTIAVMVASLIIIWISWRGFDIITNGYGTFIIRELIKGIIKKMFK